MKVSILSSFRNSHRTIATYLNRMDDLQALLHSKGHTLNLVLAYGDSKDCTGEILHEECSWRFYAHLIEVNHGGPVFGSVVDRTRFAQLAKVANALRANIPQNTDIVGFVESDLLWQPETMLNLIEGLGPQQILAPMVYNQEGGFYDTWAFRCNGERFQSIRPYHPELKKSNLIEMDSVGSVLFMEANLARKIEFPERNVVVGFCRQARNQGVRIYLDSTLEVRHP